MLTISFRVTMAASPSDLLLSEFILKVHVFNRLNSVFSNFLLNFLYV